MSTKGGVGKTTLARLLSLEFSTRGKTVCLLDFCQNSGVSTGFGFSRNSFESTAIDWLKDEVSAGEVIQQFDNTSIYFIPSNEKIDSLGEFVSKNIPRPKQLNYLQEKMQTLEKYFDVVIVDTHPAESDENLHMSLASTDFCIIPTEPDLDSFLAAKRCTDIIREFQDSGYDLDFGYILNKLDSNKLKGLSDQTNEFKTTLDASKVLGEIRYSSVITKLKNQGVMLNQSKNRYAKAVMKDIEKIVNNIPKEEETHGKRESRKQG